MRKRFLTSLCVFSGLMALATTATTTWADEVEISAKNLPAAVLKAIKAEFPKAKIEKASKEEEDGVTTFEVELEVKDSKIDVSMKADGTILEIEKEVSLKSLPKAVQKAIKARYPKAEIDKVESITKGKGGAVTYEVAMTMEVVFTAKGKLVKADEEDDDDADDEDEDDDDDKEMKSKKEKKDAKAKKKDMDDEEDEDDDDKEMKSKKEKKDAKAKKKDMDDEEDEDDDDDKEMKSKKEKKDVKSKKKDMDDDEEEEDDDEDDEKEMKSKKKKAEKDD